MCWVDRWCYDHLVIFIGLVRIFIGVQLLLLVLRPFNNFCSCALFGYRDFDFCSTELSIVDVEWSWRSTRLRDQYGDSRTLRFGLCWSGTNWCYALRVPGNVLGSTYGSYVDMVCTSYLCMSCMIGCHTHEWLYVAVNVHTVCTSEPLENDSKNA